MKNIKMKKKIKLTAMQANYKNKYFKHVLDIDFCHKEITEINGIFNV